MRRILKQGVFRISTGKPTLGRNTCSWVPYLPPIIVLNAGCTDMEALRPIYWEKVALDA